MEVISCKLPCYTASNNPAYLKGHPFRWPFSFSPIKYRKEGSLFIFITLFSFYYFHKAIFSQIKFSFLETNCSCLLFRQIREPFFSKNASYALFFNMFESLAQPLITLNHRLKTIIKLKNNKNEEVFLFKPYFSNYWVHLM